MTKVIFLDRDGTINVDYAFVSEIKNWEFIEKAPAALKMLQEAGYSLTIITSQSGIAYGLYTESDMNTLHEYMKEQLKQHGVTIAAIAFCPHRREQNDCECRKPKIGMAKQIEQKIGAIDYANSWTIGDKVADIGFGKNAGTKTALIRSKFWNEGELAETPDIIVDSLYDFSVQITNQV
jgi:D-glycero-D-manno-heptose 1,7-bisphosphate phosphatase